MTVKQKQKSRFILILVITLSSLFVLLLTGCQTALKKLGRIIMKSELIKVLALSVCTFALVLTFSGCKAIYRHDYQCMYDVYTKELDRFLFHSFSATIVNFDNWEYFKLEIDKEDFLERYKDDYEDAKLVSIYQTYQRLHFLFI